MAVNLVLLSFDIEEFDVPMEHGVEISLQKQMEISRQGTERILQLLAENGMKATFFCTAVFAVNAPDVILKIKNGGHEIASHGYYHSSFEVAHLAASKKILEEISGSSVLGYRMARMMPVDEKEIFKAGYVYNSSLNPTFIPGRYNNLGVSRTFFEREGVVQIPASVSPWVRFPLFWLSFHNFPQWMYRLLSGWTLKHDGYLNIYFHPWEFADIKQYATAYKLPGIVVKNSGADMVRRLDSFIKHLQGKRVEFVTIADFISLRVNK